MPLTASQLVNLHADLMRRSQDTLFVRYLASCFTSSHQSNDTSWAAAEEAEWALNGHLRHIAQGYLYRVTADMVQLVKHASEVLDSTDEWDHHLAPTASGIVRFDVPIELPDIRGRILKVHWLVWGPSSRHGDPVTLMAWYNDGADPDEYSNQYLVDAGQLTQTNRTLIESVVGRWMWNMAEYRADGVLLGDSQIELSSQVKAQIIAEGGIPLDKSVNMTRVVHALWLMLNQTITVAEDEYADRPATKRARRMNLPGKVTTIKLRRATYSKQPGESTVEWQHRWIVRGHWRWQACGPHRKDRRRIWIAPFVKNSARTDLPLLDRPKLYELSR